MEHLSAIAAGGFEKNLAIVSLSDNARELIEKYKEGLKERLLSDKFKSNYATIDDILTQKYHLDIDQLKVPSYENKTEFIVKGVRGNVQKANGNILTYREAEDIISDAVEEELP
jgi:hypothetical protein